MSHRFKFLLSLCVSLPLFSAGADRPVRVALAEAAKPASTAAGVARPVLGFAFDESTSGLRAISGIPGAAVLGRPFAACGQTIAKAAISPKSDFLLATAGGERRVILCHNLSGESALSLLEVPAAPDRILLSPSGATAALFYGGAQKLIRVSGLPAAPVVSEMDLSALSAPRAVLAVSDSGTVMASVPGGPGEALMLIGPGGPRTVATVGHAAAAAFLEGREEAVVADGLHNAVYLTRATGMETLAAERDGVVKPVAVAASADNREAIVATAASGIVRASLAGGSSTLLACSCKATGLDRLQGNAVFRIVTSEGSPLLVYDGDAQNRRVVVIPPEGGGGRSNAGRVPNPGSGRQR